MEAGAGLTEDDSPGHTGERYFAAAPEEDIQCFHKTTPND